MMKIQKNLVMIVGHKNPEYLIDTAESVSHYNNGNYDIVFAIDFDKHTSSVLENRYGKSKVFVSKEPNGWGRGILRTIIHALDYFQPLNYSNVFTMDSDALCVGPFINFMLEKVYDTNVFFVGEIWHSPSKDHGFHYNLRSSGFMKEYPFQFRTEMAAGPCMLWTSHCLRFLKEIGLMPAVEFDKRYGLIHFAHDQLSTWLRSCGIGRIESVDHIMEMRWRDALPTFESISWGPVPITYEHTAIIHPTASHKYSEEKCREYFRYIRNNPRGLRY